MALEVADIIPWKWDLERRMILCDINRPIELSTEEQDVTEEQLSVPDAQYFAKYSGKTGHASRRLIRI